MMLVNVPRNQELKRKGRSLVNTLVRLVVAESHQQIRVITLDHFLLKCRNSGNYLESTPLAVCVNSIHVTNNIAITPTIESGSKFSLNGNRTHSKGYTQSSFLSTFLNFYFPFVYPLKCNSFVDK